MGGLGAEVLALLTFLCEGSTAGTAVDGYAATADKRHLSDTAMVDSDDMPSTTACSSDLNAVPLAWLAFLYEGSAARAAVDGSTATADERRLLDTSMVDSVGMTSAAARCSASAPCPWHSSRSCTRASRPGRQWTGSPHG